MSSGSWGDAAAAVARRGRVLREGRATVLGAKNRAGIPPPDRWRPSGQLHRDGVAGVAQGAVGGVVQHARRVFVQLGLAVVGVGADDQPVADLGLVGGGAVDRDDARAGFAANGVGGEALAVVDVVDLDLLVFADAGHVQPVAVD